MPTVDIEISSEALKDIVITAVEGGINYWAMVQNYSPKAGTVCVTLRDEPGKGCRPIGPDDILRGLKVCHQKYPHMFNAFMHDMHGDAETADVIFQCALFGELVYG